MPGASSQGFRNTKVASRPALGGGQISTSNTSTQKLRGGRRRTIRRQRQQRTGEAPYFSLEAVIGRRTESNGDVKYLALWAAPYTLDDATWEPAANFKASDIQEFDDQDAELDEVDTENSQHSSDLVMQDSQAEQSQDQLSVSFETQAQTATSEPIANSRRANTDAQQVNTAMDDGLGNFEQILDFLDDGMILDDAEMRDVFDNDAFASVEPEAQAGMSLDGTDSGDLVDYSAHANSQPEAIAGTTQDDTEFGDLVDYEAYADSEEEPQTSGVHFNLDIFSQNGSSRGGEVPVRQSRRGRSFQTSKATTGMTTNKERRDECMSMISAHLDAVSESRRRLNCKCLLFDYGRRSASLS